MTRMQVDDLIDRSGRTRAPYDGGMIRDARPLPIDLALERGRCRDPRWAPTISWVREPLLQVSVVRIENPGKPTIEAELREQDALRGLGVRWLDELVAYARELWFPEPWTNRIGCREQRRPRDTRAFTIGRRRMDTNPLERFRINGRRRG